MSESVTTSQKRDMAVSPMDSHQNMERKALKLKGSQLNDEGSSSVQVRDDQHISTTNVQSSTDRDSPMDIRLNKGQYAHNPSTITLG